MVGFCQDMQTSLQEWRLELDPDVEYQSFDKLRDKEFANTHSQMLYVWASTGVFFTSDYSMKR